jgi:hypothetical protein
MAMIEPSVELLAPVPVEHLRSGLQVLEREPFIALGSRAWQVFRELDLQRDDRAVRVLIYASWHEDQPVPLSATWTRLYVGQVEANGGAHPEGMRFRPQTTAQYAGDNEGYWAIFWHLADLRELAPAERIPVAEMTGWRDKRPYGHPFEPEGPIIIQPIYPTPAERSGG